MKISNNTIPLLITLTSIILSSSAAAAAKTPLAIEICKNTTDFNFCRQSIYSDPHAATADRLMLAYIAFGNLYLNATDTKDYIALNLSPVGKPPDVARAMQRCLANYNESVRAVTEAHGNLDSDTYCDFDYFSLVVENNTRACERGFHGQSPITRRNVDVIKLADICFVVSKLFPCSS